MLNLNVPLEIKNNLKIPYANPGDFKDPDLPLRLVPLFRSHHRSWVAWGANAQTHQPSGIQQLIQAMRPSRAEAGESHHGQGATTQIGADLWQTYLASGEGNEKTEIYDVVNRDHPR